MLRPWVAALVVHRTGKGSFTLRIARAIIEEIQRGRLSAGDALPGSRELAAALNVNRKTVSAAYDELVAQGWVLSDPRRGTFVADSLTAARPRLRPASAKVLRMPRAAAIDGPLLWPPEGSIIFDDGLPDQRLIPAEAIAQAYGTAARSVARRRLLGYGDPCGLPELRDAVSQMLNLERGLSTARANICLTRGSQMALHAVANALVTRGEPVVFEELTYPPAVQVFKVAGAQPVFVRLGPEGLDLDHLEFICRQKPIRALYLTPHHQFPTTVMLRPNSRLRLRALAQQFGFIIIEDDYDHEFHFEHQPMFPLASSDSLGQIIYIGSFSKVLSPSLRVGYIAAHEALTLHIGNYIGVIDRQGDPITELAVVELIETGQLRRHARKMHGVYLERRNAFAAKLAASVQGLAHFTLPPGGLAVWVKFQQTCGRAVMRQVCQQRGVQFLTSSHCSPGSLTDIGARLGFASKSGEEMAVAIDAFAHLLRLASNR
jgi:GntR family transcriptional regulator / MocR family aminotransferase